MTKKLVLVSAAVLLLAASCGKSASSPTAAMQPTPTPSMSSMSLKDLMMSGGSQKCDVDTSQSQGTVYVSDGKVRGDFTTQVNGQTQTSHMINDGTTIYTWVDGMSMAMKMSATMNMATSSPQSTGQSQQAVDPNAKYDYNCSAWTADQSQFVPPSGINFTDMSSMMQNKPMTTPAASGGPNASAGASAQGSSNTAACAACNNLSGNPKAECLAALNCK